MSVAVAVATCDPRRLHLLLRCLAAIRAGDLRPARVLVVDQSGDGEVARALAGEEGVDHVVQHARGLAASRNLALDLLDEDVVCLTDDDCVPDRDWVAVIADAVAADPGLAAVTGRVEPMPPTGSRTVATASRTSAERRLYAGRVPPWHVGTGANMALNRLAPGALRFDERLGAGSPGVAGEDVDLIDRILAGGGRILYEPRARVLHERETPAERLGSRHGYGHGVGAMLVLRLRAGDAVALAHLASWLALRARLAVTRRAPLDEARVLRGTATGLRYGLRA